MEDNSRSEEPSRRGESYLTHFMFVLSFVFSLKLISVEKEL